MSEEVVYVATDLEKRVIPLAIQQRASNPLTAKVLAVFPANMMFRIRLSDNREVLVTWAEIENRWEDEGKLESIVEIEDYNPATGKADGLHIKHLFHDELGSNAGPSSVFPIQNGYEFNGNSMHLLDKKMDTQIDVSKNKMVKYKENGEDFSPTELVDIALEGGHAQFYGDDVLADRINIFDACFICMKAYFEECGVAWPENAAPHEFVDTTQI